MRANLLALAAILTLTVAGTATAQPQPAAKPMGDMKGMSMPASTTMAA